MWMEAEYKVKSLTARSGDRLALTASFDPLNLARKYNTGAERKHDLNLWFPWARSYEITYHLDETYEVVALPEAAEIKTPFATFNRTVSQNERTITVRDEFVLGTHRVSKEEYKQFNPFCRKVDALLKQKILLKKK